MIWLILVGGVVAVAGSLWVARTMRTRSAMAVAVLVGVGCYAIFGRPDMPDQPYAARLEALERMDPAQMRGDQAVALLQKRAKDAPDDPRPHWLMGQIMAAAGDRDQALFAYQSALRRDAGFVPAMKSLADLLFMSSGGEVSGDAARLYRRAFELEPNDARVGFMVGIADWQAGDRESAEALWARLRASLPPGDQRLQMFDALQEAFASDKPAGEGPEGAEPAPPEPPDQ
ncbi:hypothetical protein GC169_04920 [bacterium]|nr:hypothetical protein [bacterium]